MVQVSARTREVAARSAAYRRLMTRRTLAPVVLAAAAALALTACGHASANSEASSILRLEAPLNKSRVPAALPSLLLKTAKSSESFT